jgi:DNA-binding MarR family transcriptional regulator
MAASTRESASNESAANEAPSNGTPSNGASSNASAANGSGTDSACTAAAATDDEELLHRWFQVYAGMQTLSADLLAEVEHTAGLTAPEFRVLRYLDTAAGGGAPMNEITRLLGFSTAGTTKLIDRLCATGLVERNTDPSDRRVVLAELTTAGAGAAGRAAQVLAGALRERFVARLGEDRITALVEAFALLAKDPGGC